MIFLMSFFEFWISYVCIYLSSRYRGMSEELLDNAYIGTIRQKCRSKAMSKRMSVHIFEDSCFESITFYHISDKKSSQSNRIIIE